MSPTQSILPVHTVAGAAEVTGADEMTGTNEVAVADERTGTHEVAGAGEVTGATGVTGADKIMGASGMTDADEVMGAAGVMGADEVKGADGVTGAGGEPKEIDGQTTPGPVMTWDDPQDPQNPLNWDAGRKWLNVSLVSFQAFLSPMSSTILAVASLSIAADFNLTDVYTPALPVGTYVLGLGVGPLYLAPLSEIRGRRVVYLISFSLFSLLSVGCALAPNITALSILRFFAGTCGSAGPTLGGASIGDMFVRKERGKAQSLYALGPTAGPIIGPLIGAFIVDCTHGWRWLMWIMVIASGVTVLLSLVFLKETYGPVLLSAKAKKAGEAGAPSDKNKLSFLRSFWSCNLKRPTQLLFASPICTVMSLYMALIYGILYLSLVTIPLLYGPESVYGLFSYRWQNGLTGLAYLGCGLGTVVGTFICAKYSNRLYAHMQQRHRRRTGSDEAVPEGRMPFLQFGMILVPIGLVIFGWTAEKQVHWVLPLLGIAVFSLGMLMAYVCIQTYVVDVYEKHGASALAAVILARCTTSCVFSVTGFQLYKALGYAWGTMVIAFVCIAMLPISTLLYFFGARLRVNVLT